MKVQFINDIKIYILGELCVFKAGDIEEFSEDIATNLICRDFAIEVQEKAIEKAPENKAIEKAPENKAFKKSKKN